MGAGQHANFHVDGTHSLLVAAVNARLTGNDASTYQILFDGGEYTVDFFGADAAFFSGDFGYSLSAQLIQTITTAEPQSHCILYTHSVTSGSVDLLKKIQVFAAGADPENDEPILEAEYTYVDSAQQLGVMLELLQKYATP